MPAQSRLGSAELKQETERQEMDDKRANEQAEYLDYLLEFNVFSEEDSYHQYLMEKRKEREEKRKKRGWNPFNFLDFYYYIYNIFIFIILLLNM